MKNLSDSQLADIGSADAKKDIDYITVELTEDQLRALVDLVYSSLEDEDSHDEQTLAFHKRLLGLLYKAEKQHSRMYLPNSPYEAKIS